MILVFEPTSIIGSIPIYFDRTRLYCSYATEIRLYLSLTLVTNRSTSVLQQQKTDLK